MIASNWKLTFDPAGAAIVLLNYGDKIEDEMKFSLVKGIEIVQLVDSADPFLRDTQNAYFEFSFIKLLSQSTDALARREVLAHLSDTLDTLGKKPLKVEAQGLTTHTFQFGAALVTRGETQRRGDGIGFRHAISYSITATTLVKTTL